MKALLVILIVLLLAGYVATVVALGLLLSPLFFLLLLLLLVLLAIPFVESREQNDEQADARAKHSIRLAGSRVGLPLGMSPRRAEPQYKRTS